MNTTESIGVKVFLAYVYLTEVKNPYGKKKAGTQNDLGVSFTQPYINLSLRIKSSHHERSGFNER